eukprot:15429798-Alexandrium_andersonii.AAC.1
MSRGDVGWCGGVQWAVLVGLVLSSVCVGLGKVLRTDTGRVGRHVLLLCRLEVDIGRKRALGSRRRGSNTQCLSD